MSEQGSAVRSYLKRKVVLKLAAKVGKAKLLIAAAAVVGGFLAFLVLLAALVGATSATATEGGMTCRAGGGVDGPPARLVPIYAAAAQKYRLGPRGPGILAAINYVESDFGRSTLPGVHSGSNYAGAAGPMQFLYPSSWEPFGVDGDGDGDKDVFDPWDAIFAAANLLQTEGAPEDWYGAIFAYNHADWYVRKVERYAEKFGGSIVCTPAGPALGGEAILQRVETLYQPREFRALPESVWVGEGDPQVVDSRIWADAVWFLKTYHLTVISAREGEGHSTHGDGTALDIQPQAGWGWDETARAGAEALGWREGGGCGESGAAPICPLVPAIHFIGYNGFPDHGDPGSAGSNAHLHVSWDSSSYGCGPELCPPPVWVRVFPLAG